MALRRPVLAPNVRTAGTRNHDPSRPDQMEEQTKPRGRRSGAIRSTDLEPYTGLRWVSTLFKAAAVFIFIALAAEFVAGLRMTGAGALPVLLGETARTAVLAVVLWGGGDLVRLLVDIGHDLRAQRILMVRLLSRTPRLTKPGGDEDVVDEEAEELNIQQNPQAGQAQEPSPGGRADRSPDEESEPSMGGSSEAEPGRSADRPMER